MPMGMAPVAHTLWTKVLKFNSANPHWWNRDRFLLSNGHGCALQYILLHLSGFKVSMDDLKNFRQIDSITPGHPEVHVTPGIEVTTGPLGQGIGNAVGMAMAQAHLQAVYGNKAGFEGLFDNHTFVFCGDGCMQEGVASEAASLAGHLQLKNLIVRKHHHSDEHFFFCCFSLQSWFGAHVLISFRLSFCVCFPSSR
jgi:transketolase